MRIRYFFENLFDWMRWHVWQSILICVGLVGVISAAIVVPIVVFGDKNPSSQKDNVDDGHIPASIDDQNNKGETDPNYVPHTCTFTEQFLTDNQFHWLECTFQGCGAKTQMGYHDYSNDGKCTACQYDILNSMTQNVSDYAFKTSNSKLIIGFEVTQTNSSLKFNFVSTEASPITRASLYESTYLLADENIQYAINIEDKAENVHEVTGSNLKANTKYYLVIYLSNSYKTAENINGSFTYLSIE